MIRCYMDAAIDENSKCAYCCIYCNKKDTCEYCCKDLDKWDEDEEKIVSNCTRCTGE